MFGVGVGVGGFVGVGVTGVGVTGVGVIIGPIFLFGPQQKSTLLIDSKTFINIFSLRGNSISPWSEYTLNPPSNLPTVFVFFFVNW